MINTGNIFKKMLNLLNWFNFCFVHSLRNNNISINNFHEFSLELIFIRRVKSRWMVFFFCPNVLDWQAEVSLGVMSRFLGIHTFETSKILCSPETNVLIWYLREGAYIIFKKLFHLTWSKQANLVNFKDNPFINSCRNYQRQKKEKKIFVAKTVQIKRVNCIIFQIPDKYA